MYFISLNKNVASSLSFTFLVEDPFDATLNVGRTIDKETLFEVRGEFIRASKILCGGPGDDGKDRQIHQQHHQQQQQYYMQQSGVWKQQKQQQQQRNICHQQTFQQQQHHQYQPQQRNHAGCLVDDPLSETLTAFAPLLAKMCEASSGPSSQTGKRAAAVIMNCGGGGSGYSGHSGNWSGSSYRGAGVATGAGAVGGYRGNWSMPNNNIMYDNTLNGRGGGYGESGMMGNSVMLGNNNGRL